MISAQLSRWRLSPICSDAAHPGRWRHPTHLTGEPLECRAYSTAYRIRVPAKPLSSCSALSSKMIPAPDAS